MSKLTKWEDDTVSFIEDTLNESNSFIVLLEWESLNADMLPYKPQMPKLNPIDIVIYVRVPNRFLVEQCLTDKTCMTPEGAYWLMKKLCDTQRKIMEE